MLSLKSVLAKKDEFYRVYSVKKPSGKMRRISEPFGDLVAWQRLAMEWFEYFPIHDSSHGFRRGRSILTNAQVHKQQKYVLNIDLRDFFPSIKSYHVFSVVNNVGAEILAKLSEHLASGLAEDRQGDDPLVSCAADLAALCTLRGELPQGACTSPILANIVFSPLDFELKRIADSQGLRYSRYADDLTFSGDEIPNWLISRVRNLLGPEGFTINDRKLKLMPYYQRQLVTGVVVNNETLGVSKKIRNAWRQKLYYMGLNKEPLDENTTGFLEFVKSVKPSQFESLMKAYRNEIGPGTDESGNGDSGLVEPDVGTDKNCEEGTWSELGERGTSENS